MNQNLNDNSYFTPTKTNLLNSLMEENKVHFSTTAEIYDAIYENAFHAMYVEDENGYIIKSNRRLSWLLGYSEKELAGKRSFEIFDTCNDAFLDFINKRSIEGIANAEVTCIKKSFDTLPCRISSVIYTTNNGETRLLNTIIDISQYVSNND